MQVTNVNAKAAFFFLREAGRTLSNGGKIITCACNLQCRLTGQLSADSFKFVQMTVNAVLSAFVVHRINVTHATLGCCDAEPDLCSQHLTQLHMFPRVQHALR